MEFERTVFRWLWCYLPDDEDGFGDLDGFLLLQHRVRGAWVTLFGSAYDFGGPAWPIRICARLEDGRVTGFDIAIGNDGFPKGLPPRGPGELYRPLDGGYPWKRRLRWRPEYDSNRDAE